jgi:RpiB/LacA/LacB family sugar-phosphate isomerase
MNYVYRFNKKDMENRNYIRQEGAYDFLFIGCDRYGVEIKSKILDHFNRMFPTKVIIDLGVKDLYPDIVKEFKKSMNKMKGNLNFSNKIAIFVGYSGMGMAMCANKLKPVRAAVCNNINDVFTGVVHQNMNVLCLGNSLQNSELINIVESFMRLEFDNLPVHKTCVTNTGKI